MIDDPRQCECQIDWENYPDCNGKIVDTEYQGNGVWKCPKCPTIYDMSDRVYSVVWEYLMVKDDCDDEEYLSVNAIEYDDKLNKVTNEQRGWTLLDAIMEDIIEGAGWHYDGIEGHELGTFKIDFFWHWYKSSYEYEEYDCDMFVVKEGKI